jgi:hypothetical protein
LWNEWRALVERLTRDLQPVGCDSIQGVELLLSGLLELLERGGHVQGFEGDTCLLLDEIVAAEPKLDRSRYHSPEELPADGVSRLRAAVALLVEKAAPDEVDGYRRFVLAVADKAVNAHRENGQTVSPAEKEAIDTITKALETDDA